MRTFFIPSRPLRLVIICLLLVPAAIVCALLAVPPPIVESPAPSAIGNAESVLELYRRWQQDYTASGGDRQLVIPLRYNRGLSSAFSRARGRASLDLVEGRLSIRVTGLPAQGHFDAWLIDNRPGPTASVRPEPGDAMLNAGTLQRQNEQWQLDAQLQFARVKQLEIDLIAIVPSGQLPHEGGLLFGAPTLFQRLYHNAQPGALALLGDPPAVDRQAGDERAPWRTLFSVLVPQPAYAKPGGVPMKQLVKDGETLFFEETFDGNGRTCGTCHPADNNFTLDPHFIAALPDDDPLFVSEFMPGLEPLEDDRLLRELALVLENVDGFDNPGVLRGVPGIAALSLSMTPEPPGEEAPLARLGWSGDGSAGNGTLREFAIGAIIQHAPRSMARVEGVDFRLPTEYELDALEAFQLSLGLKEELNLSEMKMRSAIAERGRQLFLQETSDRGALPAGKCHSCHSNGGANPSPLFLAANGLPPGKFNLNLDIGTQRIEETLGRMIVPDGNPQDEGFGHAANGDGFGDGTFNIPRIIEAADSAPYGHDNSFLTLESFLSFYLSPDFVLSPAGAQMELVDPVPGFAVLTVDNSQLAAIAAFLRVINAWDNIRQIIRSMKKLPAITDETAHNRGYQAMMANLEDAIEVLQAAKIHPDCVDYLRGARQYAEQSAGRDEDMLKQAIKEAKRARNTLIF